MTCRSTAALGAWLAAVSAGAQSIPYPMMRDQILEIAHEHYALEWYCGPANIYAPREGAVCDYTTAGWKSGMAYKWGGYDSVPAFLNGLAAGEGAGDVSSAAVVPWTRGDDCSGYVSRCWKSGRYSTASFDRISGAIGWDALAPGDALNRPSSHIRLFDGFVSETGQVLVYECTTGVDPGRTTHRLLTQAQLSGYAPIRYDHVYSTPSLLAARAVAAGRVELEWIGAAADGFRVYTSADRLAWDRADAPGQLGPQAFSAVVTCPPVALRFFRIVAVSGGTESPPSVAFPVVTSAPGGRLLIVHGFDRALYLRGGTGNTFLCGLGRSLGSCAVAFDTVDNLVVQREGDPAGSPLFAPARLGDYDAVLWMLGTEGSRHDAFNRRERALVAAHLMQGGRLLVSGAEIGWDLVEQQELQEEADFLHDVLRADYVRDDAETYRLNGRAGTMFGGLSLQLDDGSRGTYAVDYPDILAPRGGSQAVLDYQGGRGGVAGVIYSGMIDGGASDARLAYFGFPVEAVFDDAARDALVDATLRFLLDRAPSRTTLELY